MADSEQSKPTDPKRPSQIDWQVASLNLHPLAREILAWLDQHYPEEIHPSDYAKRYDHPLGNVSYHFKALWEKGFLAKGKTKQVRGAVANYYGLAPDLLVSRKDGPLAKLDNKVEELRRRVLEAWKADVWPGEPAHKCLGMSKQQYEAWSAPSS